jgi:hypothetical protein
MMENRYLYYLPNTVRELQDFQKLGEIEGILLTEAALAKDTVVNNQWILTAEKSGLLRLARMMGMHGAEVMETERLREEILFRWNSRSPYTLFHLQDWLDGCLWTESYTVKVKQEKYLLQLVLELWVKEKKAFLEKHLRKIIPANLMLEVGLNVNTYRKLQVMTHGQMQELKWRYEQVGLEDLSVYE